MQASGQRRMYTLGFLGRIALGGFAKVALLAFTSTPLMFPPTSAVVLAATDESSLSDNKGDKPTSGSAAATRRADAESRSVLRDVMTPPSPRNGFVE